jgi:acetylornithine aminotransferase
MVSGGVIKPCKAFIQYICEKVQNSGGLIVIDEVTTGMGRTGRKFGYQLFDIIPDVVVLGKALGNGYPISAIITKSAFESRLSSTELYYAQSHQLDPLGAAVVKSVINVFDEDQIIEKSKDKIQLINDFLIKLNQPFVKEIRSTGMIFGIQIQPYKGMTSEKIILKLKNLLLDAGLVIGFNLTKEFIRFLPPLIIEEDEIEFFQINMKKIFDSI